MADYADLIINIPFYLTLPVLPKQETGQVDWINGSPNPFFPIALVANDSTVKRADTKPKNNRFSIDGITYWYYTNLDLGMFDETMIGIIVGNGGDIQKLPLFFQIDLAEQTPDRLKQVDEQGQLIKQTWKEFFDSNPNKSPTIDKDGNYWIGTNVFGSAYLPASEALSLRIQLITLPELQAILPTGEE